MTTENTVGSKIIDMYRAANVCPNDALSELIDVVGTFMLVQNVGTIKKEGTIFTVEINLSVPKGVPSCGLHIVK
jgi:hypothetical protein